MTKPKSEFRYGNANPVELCRDENVRLIDHQRQWIIQILNGSDWKNWKQCLTRRGLLDHIMSKNAPQPAIPELWVTSDKLKNYVENLPRSYRLKPRDGFKQESYGTSERRNVKKRGAQRMKPKTPPQGSKNPLSP